MEVFWKFFGPFNFRPPPAENLRGPKIKGSKVNNPTFSEEAVYNEDGVKLRWYSDIEMNNSNVSEEAVYNEDGVKLRRKPKTSSDGKLEEVMSRMNLKEGGSVPRFDYDDEVTEHYHSLNRSFT